MTTELSTQVVKIDLQEILDNVLNKDYWEKTWCIFDYNNITINIKLASINIRRNKAELVVTVTNQLEVDSWNKDVRSTIEIPLDQFELQLFKQSVMGTVHRLIEVHERNYAHTTDGYTSLRQRETDFIEGSKAKLEAELDELEITHEGVREAYVNENYETINLTSDYVRSFERNYMLIVHNQVDAMIEFVGE